MMNAIRIQGILLLAALLTACKKETLPKQLAATRVRVCIEDLESQPATRSLLTDNQIETKITSLTLGVYQQDGSLQETRYCTDGFDNMTFLLEYDETFTLYALANMGDMREAFPENKSSISGLTYRIPGYTVSGTGINDRGIPMAGTSTFDVDGQTAQADISLKRLMAKLNASLTCLWPGSFQTVTLHNLNRTLRPFGESRAESADDLLADVELSALDVPGTRGDFLFYLPENLQGTSGSGPRSYLEVTVSGDGAKDIQGTLTYRSHLGNNASSNYDVMRNCRYVWNLSFLPDGMVLSDWKHENHLSWTRRLYQFAYDKYYFYRDTPHSLYFYPYAYEYVDGALKNPSMAPSLRVDYTFRDYTSQWWYCDPADENVCNDASVFTLTAMPVMNYVQVEPQAPGSRMVYVDVTDSFLDQVQRKAASALVTILNYRRDGYLYTGLGSGNLTVKTGTTVRFDMRYRTYPPEGSMSEQAAVADVDKVHSGEFTIYDLAGRQFLMNDKLVSGTLSWEYTFSQAGTYEAGGTLWFNEMPSYKTDVPMPNLRITVED